MDKTYYKVVKSDLSSIWVTEPELITQYKVGEYVSSPVTGTPLAVFKNLNDAKDFVYGLSDRIRTYRIFTCRIKYKTKIPWLPSRWRSCTPSQRDKLYRILQKIKSKKEFMPLVITDLPKGTVTCKSVMLIRRVV